MKRPTESTSEYLDRLKRQLDHAEEQAQRYPGRITGSKAAAARREYAAEVRRLEREEVA